MSSNKAPSAGTKVDLGVNAPVKREGAGVVTNDSLAAESKHGEGEFASNVGSHSENMPSSNMEKTQHSEGLQNTSTSRSEGLPKSDDGAAPSYVNNQYIRDSAGPHGKNLHEGIDESNTRDGLKAALSAEPGSQDDPSRLAEQKFELNNEAKDRSAGPKETNLKTETKYDSLNSDVSA